MKKLITLLVFSVTAVQAALVFHLKLDEGATDPFATTVSSAVSTNTGVLAGSVLPVWFTTNLAPIPGAGTTAALFFDATAAAPKPSINTDYLGLTGQVARTVCAWIKSETTQPATGGGGIIVNYGGGSGGSIGAGRYTFRVTDDAGGALQLDGVNDFARVLNWNGISGNAARTLSLWGKEPASTASPNDIWAGWGDTSGSARVRWDFGLANSTAAGMRLELNSGFASLNGASIGDDAWHMVTVTYATAATGLTFYLDGTLYGTATFSTGAPNTITAGNLGIAIGAGIREVAAPNGNAARFVAGLIDDVRIYDTELTAGDVQNLYLTTVPEPSAAALLGLGGLALALRRARRD